MRLGEMRMAKYLYAKSIERYQKGRCPVCDGLMFATVLHPGYMECLGCRLAFRKSGKELDFIPLGDDELVSLCMTKPSLKTI